MSEKNHSHRRSPMIITPVHYTDMSGKLTPSSRDKIEIENIVKTHVKNLIMEINDVLEICAQGNQTHHIFETQAVLREALVKLSTIYMF
jgi:hypothetical protein